ncbi:SPOR domain-containing protein [Neorhizobium sp. T25_13]|uniref:SPOR domain-containing protein n=1 Tax=Neorhizobium sp. T25_13 TaxID=2093830 RepID=UPI000CF9FBE8|nr:SPOR domain-containing protein [Neorhizobium sp. T25_13]
MADNNLARSRNDLPDFFADDDPLAELARIVGYDDLPVAARPGSSSADTSSTARREPAFNLEDELLQEFERYDTPHLDPIHDIALDDVPQHFAAPPVEPEELEFVPAEAAAVEVPQADSAISERADIFGDEEPPLAVDAVDANDAAEPVFEPAVESARMEPVFDLPDFPAAGSMSPAASAEDPAEEFDLAAELENSIAAESEAAFDPEGTLEPEARFEPEVRFVPQAAFEPETAPEPEAAFEPEANLEPEAKFEPKTERGKGAYIPGFRMPLSNFSVARDVAAASTQAAAAASQVTSPASNEYAFEPPVLNDIPSPKIEPAPAAEPLASAKAPEPPAQEPQPAPVAAAPQKDRFSALDELIYDVQRYTLPTSNGQPLAKPVAKPEPAVTQAAASVAPSAPSVVDAPVTKPSVAEVSSLDETDPFSDEEFELALDGLELDLAEIVVEEAQAHPVQAPSPAPAPVKAEPAPAAAPSMAPVARVAPVTAAAAPVVETQVVEEPESIADLPFDPAQIADSEDQVEAIAELDVPSLPAEEPEQPPAYRPDYELDIDAELATLLAAPGKPSPARKPEIDIAPRGRQAAAEAARSPNYTDLDDFERALEEDFRRSLTTPLPAAEHEELHYSDADYVATVENARRSVRSWAVPLVLAGVVILGGFGAYTFFGSSVSGVVSGGEPVIIAADNEPIKIAPENPGGKTVPNQDKAVYDRVAGVSPKDPKQRTLISSNEEPIDVVQKTLMPDTLPLEGENDIEPTDVGETEDPRLLPQDRTAQNNTAAEQQPVTVMPRKVKTMIVRPDGKLVEQEVAAPALAAPETVKLPAAGAKPVETAAAFPEKVPASVPATPVRTQPLPASSNAGAGGILPVSTPANPAAPAEHVNVVRTNPVTPAVAAAPAQPTPAAAAPGPAPAAAQAPAPVTPVQASAPAARAPVPIARPAEQPVNVVAAVTDQGNVRAPAQPAAAAAAGSASNQVASLGSGDYVIQIASLPSQAEAQKSYQSLSAKFGNVIGGRGVDIKSAEIAGKGTFYRVRIPAGSKNDAVALCERYRAAGGTCLVGR